MAGDWLKFEKATPDKPEVFAIASALGIDPDAVVGKLLRVWIWFDTHTTDGNARSVTLALLDRISGVSGFAAAMQSVSWLESDSSGVRLPQFDRHTGETAKGRALTAKRVAKHKDSANAKGNAAGVSPPLPREEKRREEKKELEAKATVRPTPAPDDEGLFPEAWLAYPKRAGSNSRADALKCWLARLRDGESPEAMLAGTRRFAHFSAATGKTGTEYVMQAAKFYGKSMHYREAWTLPVAASPPPAAPSKTLAAIQRLEAMKHGLADSRDYDGTAKAALPWAGSDSGNGLD